MRRPLSGILARLACCTIILAGVGATADDGAADDGAVDLAELARAAKAKYEPITDEKMAAATEALSDAIAAVGAHLDGLAAAESTAWRERIKWDDFNQKLASGELDARTAGLARLAITGEPGAEHSSFSAARKSLSKYISYSSLHGNEKAEEIFQQRMDALAKSLEDYAKEPTTALAIGIGRTVGSLESAGQAEQFVAAVRASMQRPNLFATVSERLASAGIDRSVDEVEDVHENILGTATYGSAHMVGNTSLEFESNDSAAVLKILLTGQATSNNVGYNRGVSIYSTGRTKIDAYQRIEVNSLGLHPDWPYAICAMSTNVTGVGAKSKFVRKIAWKKIGQQKACAEKIGAQRAAGRVSARVGEESDKLVDDANERFSSKFRAPLMQKDEFPPLLKLQTTDDQLLVQMLQANRYELAAVGAPPELKGEHDLAVRLHQSWVGNLAEAFIGGFTLTDEKVVELLKELTGEVPEEFNLEDEDPWSISFSSMQPVRVEFNDQLLNVSIRGRRFTSGDTKINSELEIAATYKLEKTPKGSKLLRQGDVRATYTKGGFENPAKITVKTLMQKKFAALFKEEVASEGLELPGEWSKAGKLNLQQLGCDNQWLTLSWLQPPLSNKTADRSPKENRLATTAE